MTDSVIEHAAPRALRLRLARGLSTVSLVFVMYFNTSGGPFTTETLVAGVGPGLALLILLVVPIVYSIPEAMIVAELASMLPEEGGYYKWVQRAFGAGWAFQNGWWTWMYSLVDMAIYPTLFVQYLHYLLPSMHGATTIGVQLAVIWIATAINLRGSVRVGRASVISGSIVLGAFTLVAIVALTRATHAPWTPFSKPEVDVIGGAGVGLSIALWNYIGWDNASTVQGEVVDATRSYPRALAFALPLVALNYFVPIMPALAATDWTTWHEGSWPDIARAAAGNGALGATLGALVSIAGMVSALALFNALLMTYSRIPLALAVDGLLPRALAKTDSRGTPRNAVLVSAVCYSLFTLLPFGNLVVADVLLYSMALFLEFAALIGLRVKEPLLRGAFRIPLGTAGVTLLAILPVTVLLLTVALEMLDGTYGVPGVAAALAAAALGTPIYLVMRRRQRSLR